MIPFADLKRQYRSIKKEIDNCVLKNIENTSFVGGTQITEFEESFASFVDVNFCVSCANGTDSIEILLKAMGIKENDEVLVPAISWISTSEAVSSLGAIPVFVDIDPNNYTINTNLISSKITNKTKAIIPVHLYGQPCDMKAIMKIAKEYKLKVLEDCAQAHGAKIEGQHVGTFGDAASFSFYPGKNLGAFGDAGCMITNNKIIEKKARQIANHGQEGKHNHIIEGRNSRLDTIQASILSVKLRYLNKWIKERNRIGFTYIEGIKNPKIKTPVISKFTFHAFHLFVIRTEKRSDLIQFLRKNGIESSIHYPTALPFLKCYKKMNYKKSDFPIAYNYQDKILSIPIFPELEACEIEKIIDSLNKF